MEIINWVIDLGPSVMMPIIFLILALCFRIRLGRAFKAAMLVGIGFMGINLIITLLLESMGPAAEAMVKRFDLQLTVIDPGWPVAAAIGWGTPIVPFAVISIILVNIILLVFNITKTVNIDIFNFWIFMITGALVYSITGSISIAVVASLLHFIVVLIIGDVTAPRIQSDYNLKGISFPHGTTAVFVPFGIAINWIIERIPGLRKVEADPESITKKFGILGEPLTLGAIIGALLGILAGFNISSVLTLAVTVAAVMVLLPKMVDVLVEGLSIIREAAESFLKRKFPDREFYIAMDTALLIGHPAVLATGLLMIPSTLLLAIILPGNRLLPFTDLASLSFLFAMCAPYLKQNMVRLYITGLVIMTMVLYIGTDIATAFTEAANLANVTLPDNISDTTELANLVGGASTPLGWLLIKIASFFG
ncbi:MULTISPECIES: PTS galactitol transporter subunit IIC [Virgibacillus]|uniref:PTS galactitol transporter subunit IIC n=2 Tax=Virgibacillus salarius TaxID=447199 RepID=A0A941DY45_9BACI|nr:MULTISPECIES: PTS transporter subunit IIC [Bacillaceae]MBR7796303.1 PTS galactitol transporter subunit IIC [Virgibacillus salarius]MDY7043030.1 PTS transporter subunit IIC [Virgibacillus sp. M23]NAZ09011.1 PTS galactitol transporter subunit IIC [Agaribacter marinus]